eukprot:12185169-Alexandrium_andersonii.AAC.1
MRVAPASPAKGGTRASSRGGVQGGWKAAPPKSGARRATKDSGRVPFGDGASGRSSRSGFARPGAQRVHRA